MAVDEVTQRYRAVVQELAADPRVSVGAAGTGFGSSALKVSNRIFAMVSSRGEYVVKLPARRVAELTDQGTGKRFDPGHGRLMKEWLAVEPGVTVDWSALAREALEFVSAGS